MQADSLPTDLQGKPLVGYYQLKNCLEPEVRTKHKNLEVTNFLSPALSFLSGFQSVNPTVGQEEALSTTLSAPLSCWWAGAQVKALSLDLSMHLGHRELLKMKALVKFSVHVLCHKQAGSP